MKILDLGTYLLTACGVLFWIFVAFRILRYPENHIGFNILAAIVPFLMLVAAAGAAFYFDRSNIKLVIAVFAVLSIVLIAAMYHFNILVPYEVWLKRGMPPRPF